MWVKAHVAEFSVIDLDNLVPWFAGIGKDALQSAKQTHIADRLVQFFLHFSGNGINAALTEIDATADGAKQGLIRFSVVKLVNQNLSLVMKDAQGEGANAVLGHESNSFCE
ncbi:hypothetical protein D3C76_1066570 [compost metagenome]